MRSSFLYETDTGTVYGHCTGTVRALYGHCTGTVKTIRHDFWINSLVATQRGRSTAPNLFGSKLAQPALPVFVARTHTHAAHRHECHSIVFGTSLFVCQLTTLWGTGEGKNIATFSK